LVFLRGNDASIMTRYIPVHLTVLRA